MPRRRKKSNNLVALLIVVTVLFALAYISYERFGPQTEVNKLTSINDLPPGFNSHGIDISHYQKKIDWEELIALTGDTIKFIYCKATEGVNLIDPRWKRNRKNLLKYELTHGAYHFFRPALDPEQQANHFLRNYTHQEHDLPPVIDIETETTNDSELINAAKKWLDIVEERTGIKPIIYTSYHFYSTKFKGKLDNYQYWIASYSDKAERMNDTNIVHWQYSDKGKVAGINTNVDLNFSKLTFQKTTAPQ